MSMRSATAMTVGCLLAAGFLLSVAPAAAAGTTKCPLPIELPATQASRVLVFGEMHGSAEVPRYLDSVVCAALHDAPKRPLVVVLELPTSEDEVLQGYLRSEGTEADARSLLASPFWSNTDWQDGRTSEAMFALIDSLRVRSAAYPELVVATLVPASDGVGSHDARMARQLDALIDDHPEALVLVLVGNLHARRHPDAEVSGGFRSMVDYSRHPIQALVFRDSGGSIWACMDEGCGVHAMRERPEHGTPVYDLRALSGNDHYDGLIDIGRYSASPPAYLRFAKSPAEIKNEAADP